jgi:hypothetical protein
MEPCPLLTGPASPNTSKWSIPPGSAWSKVHGSHSVAGQHPTGGGRQLLAGYALVCMGPLAVL